MSGPGTTGEQPAAMSRRHRRALGVLVLAAVVALGLDAITKQLAVSHLAHREPVRLFGGLIYLVLTRNSGAAFSLGTRLTVVFPVITLLVVGWIVWTTRRLRSVPWALALGLVLGGALGNLGDRLLRAPGPFVGHVVDFISFLDAAGQGFPVFNVADSALTVGVILAVALELTGFRRDGLRARRAEGAPSRPAAGADRPHPAADPNPGERGGD